MPKKTKEPIPQPDSGDETDFASSGPTTPIQKPTDTGVMPKSDSLINVDGHLVSKQAYDRFASNSMKDKMAKVRAGRV